MDIEKFKTNIQPTLEWLKAGGDESVGFNMADWYEEHNGDYSVKDFSGKDCGTVCCIGGHVAIRLATVGDHGPARCAVVDEFLGLSKPEARELFCANRIELLLTEITPAMAVKTIEHAIETGVIDWSVAL